MLMILRVIGLVFCLSACTSNLPQEIVTPIKDLPTVIEVSNNNKAYIDRTVRWGGVVVALENKKDASWLEIVSKVLTSKGRPKMSDQTAGRFFIKVGQILDPEIYTKGRLVTVYGKLLENQAGQIGERDYSFPVVDVDKLHLWVEYPQELAPYPYHRPFYDPYWGVYWDSPWRSRYYRDRLYRDQRRNKCG